MSNLNDTTPSGSLGLALGLGALISNLSQQQQYNNLVAAHISQGMTYEQAVAAVNRAMAPVWAAQNAAYQKKRLFWYRLFLVPITAVLVTTMLLGLGQAGAYVGIIAAVGVYFLLGRRFNS